MDDGKENGTETEQPPFKAELEIEENFGVAQKVKGYCRMVHGKLLCIVGKHDLEEISREKIHGNEYVNFRCKRKCRAGKIWMKYVITPSGEKERIL